MGMSGYGIIEIKTTVDTDKNIVSKSIQYFGGIGLNALSLDFDFDRSTQKAADHLYIKNTLFRDLSMLRDGKYKIAKLKRPEDFLADKYFEYVWLPVGEDYND
jgi:hypothetical protein